MASVSLHAQAREDKKCRLGLSKVQLFAFRLLATCPLWNMNHCIKLCLRYLQTHFNVFYCPWLIIFSSETIKARYIQLNMFSNLFLPIQISKKKKKKKYLPRSFSQGNQTKDRKTRLDKQPTACPFNIRTTRTCIRKHQLSIKVDTFANTSQTSVRYVVTVLDSVP